MSEDIEESPERYNIVNGIQAAKKITDDHKL